MSFSVELWNGYEFVYNTFNLHRRGLKDFIFMLSSKHDSELEFAKNNKKIYDLNYAVTRMPSLQNAVIAFKNDLLNQYSYSFDFCNNIKEEIIEPLKTLLNDQNNAGKKYNTEARKVDKDFRDCVERLDKSRIRFHMLAKSAEDSKLQVEIAKKGPNNLNMDQKAKLEIKSQTSLKDAKEAERQYIQNINAANNQRESYIESMKRILNDFQFLEEKLIEEVKDSLRKYVIYQVALVRNQQYDIEKKASIMEAVNVQADIRNFIETNATNSLPPYKFDFIPYVSELEAKNSTEITNLPKETLTNVKNFISNVFYLEPPESEPDSIENKHQGEIQEIVNLAWEGKTIPGEEKKLVYITYIFIKIVFEIYKGEKI
jgi:hypothetical protein